ncbi:MAG: rod shape-determining protein, partial [Planctomycetaceae bacterium]|nr:rod shape-determining protein [Planctomycetaceae bacterium]
MTKNTIGIDFGTTNTYVTICPADNENVVSVRIDSDSKKTPLIPTEILYSDKPNADKNVFPMIGRLAYETYGECDDDEREKEQYRYRATFKPDIVKSADARKCAVDFLQALLREAKKNSKPLNPLDCRVIFGVPAEANKEYRNVLKQIAKEANYGDIETIEEPKGAMLSDLAGGIIPLADMQKGYLVIDFGGGTCDFAFLQNGTIRHSWGDMHLGGRLLDDLFWQWFCDENPSLKQQLIQTGEDFYCRTVQCRELKEWFSDQLIAVPNYYGKKKVGNTGGRITT